MSKEKIKHIIEQGEGISIEFKKAGKQLPQSLFETVCAFLNHTGGEILLGVDDDKNIIGIDDDKTEVFCKQIANQSNNAQKLFPSFLLEPQVIEIANKKLI
ncbi:MAG: putative DNA binding domain-containing protein [Bacteroidales bacterium]|nr:putative DNA binding domain-containing protein [Bacteroidales bacterium]